MDTKSKFSTSIKWVVFSGIIVKTFSFLTTIVLARILTPADFGLFALAFVFIDGFGLFKTMGFETALVQTNKNVKIAADTAFYIIPGLGLVVYIALLASLPIIAYGFDSPDLINVLKILGLIFIISTFSRVPLSLLQKTMQFEKRAKAEIAGQIVNSAVALVLAVTGLGIWSLVAGYLSMTILNSTLLWKYAKWRPGFYFDKVIALDMFKFSKFIFLSSSVTFLSKNFDRVVVTKLISITSLGIYSLAFNLSNMVTEYVGSKISEVLLPIYSNLQDDYYDLKTAYLKVFKGLILISLPVSTGLCLVGGDFLRITYGVKWLEAIPVLHILAFLSIPNLIIGSTTSLFFGIKKPKIQMIATLIRILLYILLIIPAGKKYGIIGISYAVLISSFISMSYSLIMVNKCAKIKLIELLSAIHNIFYANLFMAIIVIFFGQFNLINSLILNFCLKIIFGAGIFTFFIFKTEKPFIIKLKGMVYNRNKLNN